MLTDLGLQTSEQIDRHNESLSRRFNPMNKDYMVHSGCISALICENCNHLISDSLCLCVGIFICPNCQFQNGKEAIKMMEESRKLSVTNNFVPIYTDGVVIDRPKASSDIHLIVRHSNGHINIYENCLSNIFEAIPEAIERIKKQANWNPKKIKKTLSILIEEE